MSEKLKPCPFCDSTAREVVVTSKRSPKIETIFTAIECYSCGARGPVTLSVNGCSERVTDKWNTRLVKENK